MLEDFPIFQGLDPEQLQALASRIVVRSFPKNAVIINEGDDADKVYLIRKGKVKIYLADREGKEVIVNVLGPGEYFGELALFDDAPRSTSVMTTGPAEFAVISRDAFLECLDQQPAMAIVIIKNLARRIRALSENVRSLALLDVYERIVHLLKDTAREEDGKLIIEERPTHQEIANRIGASREMVTRILLDLSTGGYISVDGKRLTINKALPGGW